MAKRMKESEYIQQAIDLIADEGSWTHGTTAMNGEGEKCATVDPKACKWDALGAFLRIKQLRRLSEIHLDKVTSMAAGLCRKKYNDPDITSIVSVNDKLGHGETIQLMKDMKVEFELQGR